MLPRLETEHGEQSIGLGGATGEGCWDPRRCSWGHVEELPQWDRCCNAPQMSSHPSRLGQWGLGASASPSPSSPLADLRLQLLDVKNNPYLIKALYGLLMLLPQSSAFQLLSHRLQCVPNPELMQSA